MKREEKNQQTRRRIFDSALREFSHQGYGASSINTICSAEGISKGIIYHYFRTKDDLFLACVEECFSLLTEYLRKKMQSPQGDVTEQLEKYFSARMTFFKEQPVYQRIFCEAIITPPAHLKAEIQNRKQNFDDLNIQILEHLLSSLSLCPQVTMPEVIDTFRQFQDFINASYPANQETSQMLESHEEKCRRALNILLYGIVERKEPHHV